MLEIISKNLKKEKTTDILEKIACIKNKDSQQRAFVSLTGVFAFSEYLEEKGIKLDTKASLHSSCRILEEFDIADIRTENNVIIDIRAVLEDEYPQMCIPKEHFSKGLQADIYVGVKIDRALKKAEFTGYIKTDDISRTKGDKNYFIVNAQELNSIVEIDEAINSIEKTEKQYISVDHEKAARLFIPFIDGLIFENDKNYLIEHLAGCFECRKALINISELDRNLKYIKDKLLLDKDYSLKLLTGEPVIADKKEEVSIQTEKPEIRTDENSAEQTKKIDESLDDEKTAKDSLTGFSEEPAVSKADEKQEKITEESKTSDVPELSQSEKTTQKKSPKKRHNRDWADELAEDLITSKDPVFENEVCVSKESEPAADLEKQPDETEDNLEENLPELNLSDHKDEITLDESLLTSDIKEEPSKLQAERIEEKPVFEPQQKSGEKSEPKKENEDQVVEDILEALDEVEIINEEEDIDSLLSFIDHEVVEIQTRSDFKEEQPQLINSGPEIKEEKIPYSPKEAISPVEENFKKNKVKKASEEKIGDYAKVLNSRQSSEQENVDIFVYDEGKSQVQEITQEDLLSIFDPTAVEEEYRRKKEAAGLLSIQNLIKDKNIVAFTVAVTLSATALFIYLGQTKDQTLFSKDNDIIVLNKNQNNNNEQYETPIEKRERESIKTYTREIMKTIKNEKSAEVAVKKEIENLFKPKTEPEKELEPEKIDIKNISWELSASVAKKPKIKKYFLDIGYLLKETLSTDLYDPEIETKQVKIKIYAELNSRGNILKSLVYDGSGSEKIDAKCLNALRKIVKANKLPEGISSNEKVKFKLLIRI